jgi:hypothetical protein
MAMTAHRKCPRDPAQLAKMIVDIATDEVGPTSMTRLTIVTALGLAALFLAVEPSMACRGAQWETSTLLETLPVTAQLEQVVARVEIIEVLKPPGIFITDDWKYSGQM